MYQESLFINGQFNPKNQHSPEIEIVENFLFNKEKLNALESLEDATDISIETVPESDEICVMERWMERRKHRLTSYVRFVIFRNKQAVEINTYCFIADHSSYKGRLLHVQLNDSLMTKEDYYSFVRLIRLFEQSKHKTYIQLPTAT